MAGDGSNERPFTRIQLRKRKVIFEAALEVFSTYGARGATLEQIAQSAGMSKQNILYYFESKESIFVNLIDELIDLWIEPLGQIDGKGAPVDEILRYVQRKLEFSRDRPRESRLFANEVLQGAPNINHLITGKLKTLVDEKAALFSSWALDGKIAHVDPYDLIFSIWATTQHYADFSAQISLISPHDPEQTFSRAELFLEQLYRSLLEAV